VCVCVCACVCVCVCVCAVCMCADVLAKQLDTLAFMPPEALSLLYFIFECVLFWLYHNSHDHIPMANANR